MGRKGSSHNKTKRTRLIPVYPVRCLGPGPEHSFMSTDPRRHRICDKCKKKKADSEINYSPKLEHPVIGIETQIRRNGGRSIKA